MQDIYLFILFVSAVPNHWYGIFLLALMVNPSPSTVGEGEISIAVP